MKQDHIAAFRNHCLAARQHARFADASLLSYFIDMALLEAGKELRATLQQQPRRRRSAAQVRRRPVQRVRESQTA